MFSPDEIAQVTKWLREGLTPEKIAAEMGVPVSTLRLRLANSGYRIEVKRELIQIAAVPATPIDREPVAA